MKTPNNFKIGVSIVIILLIVAIFFLARALRSDHVLVYFVKANKQGEDVVPFTRRITVSENHIKVAIAELLEGPSSIERSRGITTEIPPNTTLLDLQEKPDSIVINLSKDFESGGGSMSMTTRLKQLTYTALDSAKKKPVYLELDGKKVEYIGGEGVEVTQPLQR